MDALLKHKIGQMLIAGFPSPEVDSQARRLVENYQVGNFALFARNIQSTEQMCTLCQQLHQLVCEKCGFAAFLAGDQEGGVVSRVNFGAALAPGTMAIAASASADPYEIGKNCGRVLGSMGILGNFAPVLDVNIDPMNPIIGSRAFSDDPDTVIRYGIPMLQGMRDGGMLAAVKHFPGHGNVSADSHLGVPRNSTPEDVLWETEWRPFREAFRLGADALMTCHVLFEEVDPEYPATLSPKIMTDILRHRMGFKGIALTDCMEMEAISKTYGIGAGAVLAVEAGCDVLCFSHTYEAVEEAALALYDAVEQGRISPQRIEESYQRIIALKKKYHLLTPPAMDRQLAEEMIHKASILALNHRVSRDSMTQVCGDLSALKNAKRPCFVAPLSLAVTGAEDADRAPTSFSALAAQRFGGDSLEIPMAGLEGDFEQLQNDAWDVMVLGLYNARFRPGQLRVLRELERQGRPLIVVMLGAPYDLPLIQNAQGVIAAYEYTWLSVHALLDAMETDTFLGHLPVRLPGAKNFKKNRSVQA